MVFLPVQELRGARGEQESFAAGQTEQCANRCQLSGYTGRAVLDLGGVAGFPIPLAGEHGVCRGAKVCGVAEREDVSLRRVDGRENLISTAQKPVA